MFLQTFFVFIINCKIIVSVKTKIECGYKQCPLTREGALNVHLIPHSHMDAGWVKTFDQYYFGTRSSVSTANVQLIFHSVLSELLHDKRRKFTFSETAYFWRWWKEQRPQTRGTFRSLVQEGRIQFAGAGWTHSDCATVSYLHALDQATWGLRKLNDTLGPCGKPKAAWQIDTYGHSREMTSLLAQMGFDGLFIGRVDHKEREAMMEEDRMEFMWRGSEVLGKMSDIMTHTLFNLYNAPDGFCFDFLCNDEPIVDDPDTREYNADKRVNDFIAQIERQAKYYDHDNIMVTMGGDFTYQSAASWFMNIDKLINHVNTHPANMSDINIFYSTPSCYLKSIYLYGRRDKAIYTEKGDLLPYGSDSSTYWTGFYSSRPSLKYFIRRAHVFLQVVKQLTVIAQSVDSYELHLLRHAVGLLAHHDAITGTSQQHVSSDFVKTLSEAVDICSKKVSNLLSYLTPTWGGSRRSKNSQHFVICHQLNMSQCRFVENQDSVLLIVYNPLSIKTYYYVCLPAIALHYSVKDFNDEEVEYQMVPLSAAVINLPGRSSNAIQEICFEAENIPPLGYTAYYIAPIRDQLEENNFVKKQKDLNLDNELIPFISNEYIKVTVDPSTGLLDAIQHVDGVRIQVSQNFYYYSQSRQTLQSGAYSFRPEKDRPTPVANKVQFHTIRGSLIKEIRQRFSDWITQVIRLYRGEEFVEFEWIVGPVPIGSDLGKEVVTIFASNISSNGEFFTDSNGRAMIKRTCWNETSTIQQKKSLPACYYPVTSKICIKGSNSSVGMCVLTDRSQGGVSYNDGEIELMIHRRLLTDDGFGLEESLNEEEHGVGLVVKGKHRIIFGNHRQEADGQNFGERVSSAARRWEYEPWLFFASGDKINKRKWQNVRNKRYSSLKLHGLPRNIHVLTLEPWKGGSVLVRLENTLEKTNRGGGRYRRETGGPEDTTSFITVELRKLFLTLKIKTVRETTLGANQWLDDARQMDWSTRYVYNGGDDGIMTDDMVDDDEQHAKQADNTDDHYSDEEENYPRKHNRKVSIKNRVKSAKYTYDRRKRSLNDTKFNDYDDDFGENNLIIDLLNDHPLKIAKVIEIDDNYQRMKRNVNDSVIPLNNLTDNKINDLKTDFVNDTIDKLKPKTETKESTTENIDAIIKTTKTIVKKKLKTKGNNKNKSKYKHYIDLYEREEEIRSSEEDFSSNLKKRSRRKNKRGGKKKKEAEEVIYDDSDDGITKSIYEMYYKPKNPYKNERRRAKKDGEYEESMKRVKKDGEYEEAVRRVKKDGEYEEAVRRVKKDGEFEEEGTRTRNKNMPFLRDRYVVRERDSRKFYEDDVTPPARLKRRNAQVNDDYDDDDDYDEEDSQEEKKRTPRNRRKRSTLPKDEETPETNTSESEPSEPEYIVTLRPTQIRTFVVWFDRNKKTYTI